MTDVLKRLQKVPWSWVAGSLLIGVFLGIFLAPSVPPALVGMLGLIAGLLIARQTQQSHLVTSTWPARARGAPGRMDSTVEALQ